MCSSIAWQQSEKARLSSIRENKRKEVDVECLPATADNNKEPFKKCAIPYDAAAAMEDFEPDKARFVNKQLAIPKSLRQMRSSQVKAGIKRYFDKQLSSNAGMGHKGSQHLRTTYSAVHVEASSVPCDAAADISASYATLHSTVPTSGVPCNVAANMNGSGASHCSTAPNCDAATTFDAASGIENEEFLSRIYICSRTHTQLSQLIKGLKDTVYTPSMAVLGSRDQMCIHPTVVLSETKNEDCIKLIGGGNVNGCSFLQNANVLAKHSSMRVVWDIEDIVSKGRQFRACPYFTAQDIAENADVVFCPYSFLLDKCIRESAGINLKNNIVIFDEAHNLEDQCREAASFVLTNALLNDIMVMLDACKHFPYCPADVTILCFAIMAIRSWIQEREASMSIDGKCSDKIMEFEGDQVPLQLSAMGLTRDNVKGLSLIAGKVQKWHIEVIENSQVLRAFAWVCPVDGKTHSVVPGFSVCIKKLQMILVVSGYAHEFVSDYAMCIVQRPLTNSAKSETGVNIMCLNPGVAFRDLREQCRSLVLTSGAV
jgi:hypothetical protein